MIINKYVFFSFLAITAMSACADNYSQLDEGINRAEFTERSEVKLPVEYRNWVHVGTRIQVSGINIIDGK